MKIWIVVGALDGKIEDVEIYLTEKEALVGEREMAKEYSFPEIERNDVALFPREI